MAKSYDAATKHLLEIDPPAWLAAVGLPATGPVRVIDSELSTVTAEADTVYRVGEPVDYLAHLEIQSGRDKALPRRLLHYNVLLNYRHEAPARSVAILLRREADGPELTGLHQVDLPDGTSYLDFRYSVVRVWTLDVEAVLRGGLGVLPLAPLAKVAVADLPAVIGRMKQRFDREVPTAEANELWSSTNILMGLVYSKELTERLLQGVRAMKESVTYQAILAEGEVIGEVRGKIEGKIEGKVDLLLDLGSERYGDPDPTLLAAIRSIDDSGRIKQLIKHMSDFASWAELLASD